jgi:hypothetical protein
MPDDDGIIWHEGHGYYLSQKGREAQFLQRRPKMHPGWKAAEFKLSGMENAPRDDSEKEISPSAVSGGLPEAVRDRRRLRRVFP